MKKAVTLTITLLLMGTIFFFSAQPGDASSELSNEVTVGVEDSIFANLIPVIFDDNMNANIRKWAHILIYFALGVSVTTTAFAFDATEEQGTASCIICAVVACVICFIYAVSDEIHQLFVPGRAGMISDVFLDTVGALPGELLVVFRQIHKAKKNNCS